MPGQRPGDSQQHGALHCLEPLPARWVPTVAAVHSSPRPEGAGPFQQPGTEDSGIWNQPGDPERSHSNSCLKEDSGNENTLPQIRHFGIPAILSWRQRISGSRKKPSGSSSYQSKSRNFRDIRTTVNPLSQGSFMAMKTRKSWSCGGRPQINLTPH